jgi:hypothetical protein
MTLCRSCELCDEIKGRLCSKLKYGEKAPYISADMIVDHKKAPQNWGLYYRTDTKK